MFKSKTVQKNKPEKTEGIELKEIKPNPFKSLPTEIKAYLFQFFEPKLLAQSTQVCKEFKTIIEHDKDSVNRIKTEKEPHKPSEKAPAPKKGSDERHASITWQRW